MTQEEKQLLLQDLCARLPYGVKANIPLVDGDERIYTVSFDDMKDFVKGYINIKPCIRPMSSMTEEEFKELATATELQYDQLELMDWGNDKTLEFYLSEVPQYCVIKVFDWLNARHFDYRGLIPMGLALEALEGTYNTK